MTDAWRSMYCRARLKWRYVKTLINTRSPKTALWSYLCSNQYRNVMFERPIHFGR